LGGKRSGKPITITLSGKKDKRIKKTKGEKDYKDENIGYAPK
jgi:hypothetical protein